MEKISKLLNSTVGVDRRIGIEKLIEKIRRESTDLTDYIPLYINLRLEGDHIILNTPSANADWDKEVINNTMELYKWNNSLLNMWIDWDEMSKHTRQIYISVNLK